MQKLKDYAMILAVLLSSVTTFKFKMDKDGVQVELDRTKQALSDAQDNFQLSSLDCEKDK